MRYGRIVIPRYGGPEVLAVETAELREPRQGEVRVRMQAAGVSWVESMLRHGSYPGQPKPPLTPGYDVVGVVDATGPGVTRWRQGDAVAALLARGGYSEVVYVPAGELVAVPAGVDPAEAVCLVLNYSTAYQMLHRVARVQSAQRILVHGAAGGVGTALLQLGGLSGLEMVGTASAGKLDLVERLGARALDYRRGDLVEAVRAAAGGGPAPAGVDAAFDAVGGASWRRSRRCLRRGGLLVAYGTQAALAGGVRRRGAEAAAFATAALLFLRGALGGRRFAFYSITGLRKSHPDWFEADLGALFQLLAERRIQPLVARRLPWTEARRANELLESGAVEGKIVLTATA